jgi:hypothetical protein
VSVQSLFTLLTLLCLLCAVNVSSISCFCLVHLQLITALEVTDRGVYTLLDSQQAVGMDLQATAQQQGLFVTHELVCAC